MKTCVVLFVLFGRSCMLCCEYSVIVNTKVAHHITQTQRMPMNRINPEWSIFLFPCKLELDQILFKYAFCFLLYLMNNYIVYTYTMRFVDKVELNKIYMMMWTVEYKLSHSFLFWLIVKLVLFFPFSKLWRWFLIIIHQKYIIN